MGSCEQDQMIF